jgi:hypothetical protein
LPGTADLDRARPARELHQHRDAPGAPLWLGRRPQRLGGEHELMGSLRRAEPRRLVLEQVDRGRRTNLGEHNTGGCDTILNPAQDSIPPCELDIERRDWRRLQLESKIDNSDGGDGPAATGCDRDEDGKHQQQGGRKAARGRVGE